MIVNEIAKFWNPPMAAEELLRVAELVEDLLVLGDVGAARSRWFATHARLPLGPPEWPPKPVSGLVGALIQPSRDGGLGLSARVGQAGERQLQGEAASGASRRDRDLAAGAAGEPPREREPEARAVGPAGRGGAARARLEDRSPLGHPRRPARRRRRRLSAKAPLRTSATSTSRAAVAHGVVERAAGPCARAARSSTATRTGSAGA